MALMSDVDLPVEHVRDQIASTLDLIVHMSRLPDGRRVIARISAIDATGTRPVVRDLYSFGRDGRRHPDGGSRPTSASGGSEVLLSEAGR
jgi:pilus assembly protein CpaF